MPIGLLNKEWLNHNSTRRYPFADDADLTDTTGSFRLPDDFLVELDLPVHAGMNTGPVGFFVQSVSVFASGYGIVVAYQAADLTVKRVATALIPKPEFTRNSTFQLGGVGDFADTIGKVVIGRLDSIDAQPPGFWQFTLATGRLDPDCVRPILRGVSSITCVNGDQRSVPLYGDIELVAGNNMQLVPILQTGEDPIIRINAISGEGTVDDCVCEGDEAQTTPITSVNGIDPTVSGNINIVGSDCVQIVAIPNGLRIVDVCAQPCCGCPELETITRDLERLSSQAAAVDLFVDRLQTAVDAMSFTVLGSKIGDRNCISCG